MSWVQGTSKVSIFFWIFWRRSQRVFFFLFSWHCTAFWISGALSSWKSTGSTGDSGSWGKPWSCGLQLILTPNPSTYFSECKIDYKNIWRFDQIIFQPWGGPNAVQLNAYYNPSLIGLFSWLGCVDRATFVRLPTIERLSLGDRDGCQYLYWKPQVCMCAWTCPSSLD